MNIEIIELSQTQQSEELMLVVNACEHQEPLLQRSLTAADLREFLSDATTFQEYGQLWRNAAGQIMGFGYLRNYYVNNDCVSDLKFFVQPHAWNTDVGAAILDWALSEATNLRQHQQRSVMVYSDCLPDSIWRKQLLETHHLIPMHYFYQMERTVDLPIPDLKLPTGYVIRPFEPSTDLTAWVDVFNVAYGGQWNFAPTTEAIQSALRSDPRYQPRYDLVLSDADGQLVAMGLGFVLEREGIRAGWVLELGVLPNLRGKGLAKTLLNQLLRLFRDAELTRVRLSVNGSNSTEAKRLYEQLGFHTISSEILYGCVITQ